MSVCSGLLVRLLQELFLSLPPVKGGALDIMIQRNQSTYSFVQQSSSFSPGHELQANIELDSYKIE